MYYAGPRAGSPPRAVAFGNSIKIGEHQFFNLARAFTREEDPEYVKYGGGMDERSGFEGRPSHTYVTRTH